ncbi:MAG: transposase [Neptuniibacter sp.]
MSRALRIEFPGAYYHITSRGNARSDIYLNDEARRYFLTLMQQVCERFRWFCHGYCLMDNHYHLLIETAEANLSKGMRHLNGVYTQWFNRTFGRVGHLFQGRYKAILVDSDSYLLELCRYIVLNPVRSRMCHDASEWPWSSYRSTAGLCQPYEFLTVEPVLVSFDSNYGNRNNGVKSPISRSQ